MSAYIRIAVVFALVYLALTANLQPSNIVVAVAIGTLVALIIRPEPKEFNIGRFPEAAVAIILYVIYLTIDVIRNGVNVARIVLDPKLPIRPGIIAIKSGMKTELGTALSAHAITITPGEQVIEIGDDGTMYTHCLDAVTSGAGADEAQDKRRAMLQQIFE
jgi:multicomponent Na+:H+ antiporter subunit E